MSVAPLCSSSCASTVSSVPLPGPFYPILHLSVASLPVHFCPLFALAVCLRQKSLSGI